MPKYDVCLSFAGEDRPYVDEVARHLTELGVTRFYDTDEQADLWGKNLIEHLDQIYRHDSRFCVMFVSQHYASKMWTKHERQSAFDRALISDSEYVLPVRFDDTDLPALRVGTGYLDLRRLTPRELAGMIAQKVGTAVAPPSAGWEYQLFSDTVGLHMRNLQDKRISHEMGFAAAGRTITTDTDALDYFMARSRTFDQIINGIADLLSPGRQQWAFGPAGRPGDKDKIRLLANRFVEQYENLLDWSADLRGATTPDRFTTLYATAAQLADQPLKQIEQFVEDFTAASERGAGDLELTLSYDMSPVEAELQKVQTT
ncbi:toll/interleukin-1 receptor domain-containing protein [Lentzea sp. NEAU-D7]|uniref:toll/interleukin-1 receptor domain-containing protein n=1 Tax=Lentzea sp. NEAU-D7 TaxID=2994667 RepID=UPI00224A5764|nr:TIR domain-containing protein [Lentzea sp. NEAU-D7]MCX2953151.1 TIR domain-containing protein [Lentzea sp. NEAU-D7]